MTRNRTNLRVVGGLMALTMSVFAEAEDIDLYRNDAGDATNPNVVIAIDNSANWNASLGDTTKREQIHEALKSFFADDSLIGEMNVGLMLYSKGNNPRGGKVIERVRPLTESYRDHLMARFDTGLPKTNNAPTALLFEEMRRYFGGLAPASGTQDGAGGKDGYDELALADDGTYDSPADVDGVCGRHFFVLIANGAPDSGENKHAERALNDINGVLQGDPISLDPSQFEANWADEYARYLVSNEIVPDEINTGHQSINTFVIDVHETGREGKRKFDSARALLKSTARQGNGRYFASHSGSDVAKALKDISDQIRAINSVFAATALPVSVNVRGTNLNQIYLGVFRPNPADTTLWQGNLKLYQLGRDSSTGETFITDRNGVEAQSDVTGFIVSEAESFWTHDSEFWSFDPRGTPPTVSDLPDGEVVEKGGVHQQVRDLEADGPIVDERNVYTCTGDCASGSRLALTPFAVGNGSITATDLAVADSAERDAVIRWIAGEDNAVDEDQDGSFTDARASIHGDVLHSKPAVVNYNRDGTDNDIVAFYGANDGLIRAVRAGIGSDRGFELWSFVAPEFFPYLKRLRDNDEVGKTYFADGNVAVFSHDGNGNGQLGDDGDTVNVYFTMRRGGRFLYAMDVNDPSDPKLLWRRAVSDAGYSELGQTWSEPVVGDIAHHENPVLIFGAGYDPAVDDVQGDSGTGDQGRGLFVVDALTGDPVWQVGPSPDGSGGGATRQRTDMAYSMPAHATAIDRDGDGNIDRIYQPDTGGNIWRVDMVGDSPADWVVTHLASLGSDQKFLNPPDVVASRDTSGRFDAVLIGSGDRADPLETAITNRFYMIKDRAVLGPDEGHTTIARSDLFDATSGSLQDGDQQAIEALEAADGWFVTLQGAGEKVVSGTTTANGVTFFNTLTPPPSDSQSCTVALGTARSYAISFEDGTAVFDQDGEGGVTTNDRAREVPGGGFPPSPVPVVVMLDGEIRLAVISGTETQTVPNVDLGARKRLYFEESALK